MSGLNKEECISRLFKGAEARGKNSNPDYEVGDLQDILRTCFSFMTGQQVKDVYQAHVEIAEEAEEDEEVA